MNRFPWALVSVLALGCAQEPSFNGDGTADDDCAEGDDWVGDDDSSEPTEVDADQDGFSVAEGDCDDQDAGVHPDAEEACDGVDTDCDGFLPWDEVDEDGDTWFECEGDCDDSISSVHPGADERCDGLDNDCDGLIPPDEADLDEDGWRGCAGDCDDQDEWSHPGMLELCSDGVDNDCDGGIDDADVDGDGHIDVACGGDDCDDDHGHVFAGAPERCNGLDDDCDGSIPDDEVDGDGDGSSTCEGDCDDSNTDLNPAAVELCDGVDNDCDDVVDEQCIQCSTTVHWPADSIGDAIAQAAAGDVVCIDDGTYEEDILWSGEAIHVVGLHGPRMVTIEGTGIGAVVSFSRGEEPGAVLEGVTVSGGDYGVWIQDSSPTLRGVHVWDNLGTGIMLQSSSSSIVDSTVSEKWEWGGAGGIAVIESDVVFERLRLERNIASTDKYIHVYWSYGGGMYIWQSTVRIDNSQILRNAATHGGGIYSYGSTVTVDNSIVADNTAGYEGAGYGAGVYARDTSLQLTNVVVAGNDVSPSTDRNGSAYGTGGGIAAEGTTVLTNVSVLGNRVEYYSFWYGATYISCENGGLALGGVSMLANTTIQGNHALEIGGLCASGNLVRLHTNLWGNEHGDACNLELTGIDGNISEDPGHVGVPPGLPQPLVSWPYRDTTWWDFHLHESSAQIDAGDPATLDPDGSPSDIGAFGGPGAALWDLDGDGFPGWWQPGPYDHSTYPNEGWDCDDLVAGIYPGNGC